MNSKIVFRDASVRLHVNGKDYPAAAFMTYFPNEPIAEEFRNIGMPVFSFGVYASDRGINDLSNLRPLRKKHFWVGEDEYDFSDLDEILEIAAPGGEGAFIFPRVDLDAPSWWIEKHPEELARDDRGQPLRQSLVSPLWRKDAKKALRAMIDHVDHSKWKECVIGYHIAAGGTEEWTHHQTQTDHQWRVDFSSVSKNKYHDFLLKKYASLESLNEAWNTSYKNIEEVPFPSLMSRVLSKNGPVRGKDETNVIDFWEYNSFMFSDTILDFCHEVKACTGGNLLTGAFYGYFFLYGIEKGHYDMRSILESEDIDFLATTSGGAARPFGTGVSSLNLHGKMYFNEGDIRTCMNTLLEENLPHAVPENDYYKRRHVWRGPSNMFLSLSSLRRGLARVLTGHAGIWLFDMFGGWFRSPEMMELFKKFISWQKEQTGGPIKSEIAVLVDETGFAHFERGDKGELYGRNEQIHELDKLGAPYDLYLASDLETDLFPEDQYKLILLINMVRPTENFKNAVRKKLYKDHKTVIYTYFDDFEGMGTLTGLPVTYERFSKPSQAVYENTLFPPTAVNHPSFKKEALQNAYVLSCMFDPSSEESEPAVCALENSDYTTVVSVMPCLPENLLKTVSVFSGVNLYSRTDDVIYAGGRFIAVYALSKGEKRLNLPFPVSALEDAETGAPIPLANGVNADFEMEQFETRIFRIHP